MKLAYYDNITGIVIAWLDDSVDEINEMPPKEQLHRCSDKEWTLDRSVQWQIVDGKIVEYVEPPEFSVFKDGKWVEDTESRRKSLEERLMQLADHQQSEATRFVLGYKATDKQIERYRDKYERAKAGEWGEATNQDIIKKHEAARAQIRHFVDRIEEYRGFVDDLIQAGKLDKAEKALKVGATLDEKTTEKDLVKIFKEMGG